MPSHGLNTMEIKISAFASKMVIYKNVYPLNFNGENDIDKFHKEIKSENYTIKLTEKWFDGVHISLLDIITHRPEDFYFESSQNNIAFIFCLNGVLDFYCSKKVKHLLSISSNKQNARKDLNDCVISVNGEANYIYIQLTEEYFKRVTNQQFKAGAHYYETNSISPELALLISSFYSDKYLDRVERIFLESKILSLLVFYIEQKNKQTASSLKNEDVKKILLAKQLVESNLQKPNSLIELSRKAGINDFKLKKGFKEITGLTVFGYLYKIRMEKAYEYLHQEKKSVSEVAFLIGYKTAQHFIAAFKKYYQILPGSLNKAQKINIGI